MRHLPWFPRGNWGMVQSRALRTWSIWRGVRKSRRNTPICLILTQSWLWLWKTYKSIKEVIENDSGPKSTIEMKPDINCTSYISSSALDSLTLLKILFLRESLSGMMQYLFPTSLQRKRNIMLTDSLERIQKIRTNMIRAVKTSNQKTLMKSEWRVLEKCKARCLPQKFRYFLFSLEWGFWQDRWVHRGEVKECQCSWGCALKDGSF